MKANDLFVCFLFVSVFMALPFLGGSIAVTNQMDEIEIRLDAGTTPIELLDDGFPVSLVKKAIQKHNSKVQDD